MYKLTLAFRARSLSRDSPNLSAAEKYHVTYTTVNEKEKVENVTLLGDRSIVVVTLRCEDGVVVASTAGETKVAAPVKHVEVNTGREGEEFVQGCCQWLSS